MSEARRGREGEKEEQIQNSNLGEMRALFMDKEGICIRGPRETLRTGMCVSNREEMKTVVAVEIVVC